MTPNDSAIDVATITQGPAMTNAYLVGERGGDIAAVIDPAWDGDALLAAAEDRGWRISQIWLTHAHFDHIGGAAALFEGAGTPITVALHPLDHPLWQVNGGAASFGFDDFDPGPEPTVDFREGMVLRLGSLRFTVHHTPGHTPGHVILSAAPAGVVFCGDLIFQGSVGRVDLPGGDGPTLIQSIKDHILSLPDDTRLFPGHGPPSTVGRERVANPFLVGL
jgi:hydroxyacylglutathione hydrolase